jgi:hypothetical protein
VVEVITRYTTSWLFKRLEHRLQPQRHAEGISPPA